MKLLYICIFFISVGSLFGQITIDWNEIPHEVGTQWLKIGTFNASVDLGTTGGPQTWDFTTQPMGNDSCSVIIVEPGSTPYIDSFPGANLVYCSPAGSDTGYEYFTLNNNFIIQLGMGGTVAADSFIWKYKPSDSIPWPQRYGDSHRFHYRFRYEVMPGYEMEYYHHGVSKFDAYGTVTIPYGSYNCLRMRTDDTSDMTTYFEETPIITQTMTSISYQFVTENYGAVVCVKSDTNETNPNYTDALILERLTSFTSGIEEYGELSDIQCAHYPQLFSDYTTIQYSLPAQNHVELILYDINGRIVKTLVNDIQAKGDHSYRWYGDNNKGELLGSGIYFYQLKVGNNKHRGRVLLIR